MHHIFFLYEIVNYLCSTQAMFLPDSITSFYYFCILQRHVTPYYEKTAQHVCRSLRKKRLARERCGRGTRSIANLYRKMISFSAMESCNHPVHRVCVSQTRNVSIIAYTWTDRAYESHSDNFAVSSERFLSCTQIESFYIKFLNIAKNRNFKLEIESDAR